MRYKKSLKHQPSQKENKIRKNQVNQYGNEDTFEEKFDKKDKEKSDFHNNTSEKLNKIEEEIRTLHGKLGNVAAELYFNLEIEIYPSGAEEINNLSKHNNFDYEMASF